MVVMRIAEEGRNCNALTVDFLEHEVFGPPQLLPHCSSSSNQIRTEKDGSGQEARRAAGGRASINE